MLLDELRGCTTRSSDVEVTFAADANEAVEAIRAISGGTRIAVGKSAVVAKELVPALTSAGFDIIDTYHGQFDPSESLQDLSNGTPKISLDYVSESFFCSNDLNRFRCFKLVLSTRSVSRMRINPEKTRM